MSLNIKRPEAEQLAHALARQTGECKKGVKGLTN